MDRQNGLANRPVYRHTEVWNSTVNPKGKSVNQVHNRAHDSAHLLVRRLERDLRWAKDRRRQHEREIEDARRLLATPPISLAGKTAQFACIALLLVVGGYWAAVGSGVPGRWMTIVLWVASALALAVFVSTLVSLVRLRNRRAAAQKVLDSHAARFAHTQYHLSESVHSYIGARGELHNTRQLHLV